MRKSLVMILICFDAETKCVLISHAFRSKNIYAHRFQTTIKCPIKRKRAWHTASCSHYGAQVKIYTYWEFIEENVGTPRIASHFL